MQACFVSCKNHRTDASHMLQSRKRSAHYLWLHLFTCDFITCVHSQTYLRPAGVDFAFLPLLASLVVFEDDRCLLVPSGIREELRSPCVLLDVLQTSDTCVDASSHAVI